MTSECVPKSDTPESCSGASDCPSVSTCSTEIPCLPSTGVASRCQTPTFLTRSCRPTSRLATCYIPGSYNIPYFVGSCGWCEEGAFNSNEKETMQFLNDRLACYLDRVRGLEQENADLECKIREQCELEVPLVCPDYQCYFNTIENLQQKILCTKAENSRLTVQIDNFKLAADDFKSKYETELSLRQLVEADISGLRKILDDLTLCKCDLEAHVESLKEDLLCLKKNHDEEVNLLREQLGDRLNIELDTTPPVDLNKVLDDMRCQYEAMVTDNRRDVEQWFTLQTEELNQQQLTSSEELQCCQSEILELKRTANALDIELQAQHGLIESLECTKAETETQYSTQLAQMQCLIDNVESQLADIRCDLERQNQEYQVLLDVKALLECEITTYRSLLESEDCKLPCNPCSSSSTSGNTCGPCTACLICTVEGCRV
ncbi:keratin, type I cytoskeletal 40 [Phascolarctos cinereus]|uniref:Keratin, type I cytoskeletal 40 n=1 Tax=Phascolarctos cinereus TaxID=38626 RepID=A0A6P5L564_PHACI|nr:keratin, type I cytoskeletal 40 [Phascolarctos cinereus]